MELYQGPNPKFGHWQPEKNREIKIQIEKKNSWNQNYHWFFIFRDDVIISTNLFGKGFFLVASWDNSHMITHGFGKEDSHLSKTAKTLKKAKKSFILAVKSKCAIYVHKLHLPIFLMTSNYLLLLGINTRYLICKSENYWAR